LNNFIQLVRNEQMKLYSQIATWIMLIILGVLVIGFGVLMKVDNTMISGEGPTGENWKQELQQQNTQLKEEQQGPPGPGEEREQIQYPAYTDIEMNQYRIQNDIKPSGYDVWDFLQTNRSLISIISLFTIIVAAGMIANEFKWGTIKLLLIRPISRTKILLSKYVSVLLFAGTMLLCLYALSFIVGAALFGIDSISQTYLFRQAGEIQEASIFQHTVSMYLLSSVNLLLMATFAFMISAVFRNSSLAIGVAIFLMMAGNSIVLFLMEREWAKYILFANTDLTMYLEGNPMFNEQTAGFSVAVLFVYYVIFVILAWVFFTKRDVASN